MVYDTRTFGEFTTRQFTVTRYTYGFPNGQQVLLGVVGPQTFISPPIFGQRSTVSSVRGKRPNGFSLNKFELVKDELHSMDSSTNVEYIRRFRFWGEDYMEVYKLEGDLSWYRYNYDGVVVGAKGNFPGIDPAFMEQKAVLGAYGKATAPTFELGVNLGELRETFEMLQNPFSALRKLLTQKRKRIDNLAGTWMEHRYGVMPLVYTIKDIIEAVKTKDRKISDHLYSGRSQTKVQFCERIVDIPIDIMGLKFQACRYYTTTFRVAAICYYQWRRPPTLSYMLGTDWSAIPAIAWELTKLSWLVDWWLGVGDFLKAHRRSGDMIFMGDCATHIREDKVLYTVMGEPTYWGIPFSPNLMTCVSTHTEIYRNPAAALTKFPLLDVSWHSLAHTIDALSLSWQKMPFKH
jgi:hypothetical protein